MVVMETMWMALFLLLLFSKSSFGRVLKSVSAAFQPRKHFGKASKSRLHWENMQWIHPNILPSALSWKLSPQNTWMRIAWKLLEADLSVDSLTNLVSALVVYVSPAWEADRDTSQSFHSVHGYFSPLFIGGLMTIGMWKGFSTNR